MNDNNTHTAWQLASLRPQRAKRAFTTRCVSDDVIAASHVDATGRPANGDLVLCEVLGIGQHKTLHSVDGRRQTLFPGDHIVLAYGARYAPDQFEAQIPADLEACDLVAAGGLAGRVCASHGKMALPTQLQPLGLLADDSGQTINIRHYGLDAITTHEAAWPPVIAVLGTSMNSGKTTAAVDLIRGLRAAGQRVGAAKVTGTGAATDTFGFRDAGAHITLDFTDAGHGSTYQLDQTELWRVFTTLVGTVAATAVDVIVLEVADGLYQRETAMLIDSPAFRQAVDATVFAAQDGAGAVQGAAHLQAHGLPVAALSGVFTSSVLGMREAAAHTHVAVVPTPELATAEAATAVLTQAPAMARPTRAPAALRPPRTAAPLVSAAAAQTVAGRV